jgi:tetratricopeptide (TPR) repeat protein
MDKTSRVWPVENLDVLLTRGCRWLNNYLIVNPQSLIQLSTCQTPATIQAALPYLITQSEAQARAGKTTEAIQGLTTAKQWSPTLSIDPITRANNLAQAPKLQEQADRLAKELKFSEAIDLYRQAISLDESLKFDPEARAKSTATRFLDSQGDELTNQQQFAQALSSYQQAEIYNKGQIYAANQWANLCLQGSIYQQAHLVLPACKEAIDRAKDDSDKFAAHLARGISSAITNDKPAALADLEIAMTLYKTTQAPASETSEEKKRAYQQNLDRLQSWVSQLKADQNPFTETVLKELQKELKN